MINPSAYRDLLRIARRHSRRADEAEDLLQDALLDAVAAGRADLGNIGNRLWLAGVIRNRGTLAARTAARRKQREMRWHEERPGPVATAGPPDIAEILRELPKSLKIVAALAFSGHSRREIGYLLGLTDTALRQRLAALKRRLAPRAIAIPAQTPGLRLELSYGRIRDALLPKLVNEGGLFASHDPDGHLLVFRRSQTEGPRQLKGDQSPRRVR
jgi:DNA-directed RNA polymerase specialized sigma24 family protein